MKYKKAALGGTFDHLHMGHKKLLKEAFNLSEKVIIGITDQGLVKHKFLSASIEPFEIRQSQLTKFLHQQRYSNRFEIIALHNYYGSTHKDETIEALFLTEDTYANGLKINNLRLKNKVQQLALVKVDFAVDEKGDKVTSERIRLGEIDQSGHPFSTLFDATHTLRLPEEVRESLRQPIGEVFPDGVHAIERIQKADPPVVISVGDVVTAALYAGLRPAEISVIDHRTQRHDFHESSLFINATYENAAGSIETTAVVGLQSLLKEHLIDKSKKVMEVGGEEDLLTLPAILLAPLGTLVLYGQREMGIVIVVVTLEKKRQVENLLKTFTTD